jgi:peptide/nickel transport system permease protein
MGIYVIKRLLGIVPVMGVVAVFVFLLLHLTPGDPAVILAGDFGTEENIERIRISLGLDRPIYEQFVIWVTRLLQGDLGESIMSRLPVTYLIMQRLEPTLVLASTTIIFAVILAVPMGILAGWKSGLWADRIVMVFSVLGFSVPVFVIAYILVLIFSVDLRWFPVQGYSSLSDGLLGTLRSITLPTISLGLAFIALIARITRATMIEVLAEDYIRTAYAKGLSDSRILIRHALKNAGVPIVTVIGVGIAGLLGGVVITETVFNLPGLGRLMVDAILARDYPIIQAVILLFSAVYVVINVSIDIIYTFIDPRIRY